MVAPSPRPEPKQLSLAPPRPARVAQHRNKKGAGGTAAAESPFPRQQRPTMAGQGDQLGGKCRPSFRCHPIIKQFVCRSPEQCGTRKFRAARAFCCRGGSRVSLSASGRRKLGGAPGRTTLELLPQGCRREGLTSGPTGTTTCENAPTGVDVETVAAALELWFLAQIYRAWKHRAHLTGGVSLRDTPRRALPRRLPAGVRDFARQRDSLSPWSGRDYSGSTTQRIEVAVAIPAAGANGQ